VISNVPGPGRPMYFDGAAAKHYFPVSIPYHNCALNITVQSYCDTLDFGLTACRRAIPDAQKIADYMVEEFFALEGRKTSATRARPGKSAPRKRLATKAARTKGNGAANSRDLQH